MMLFSLPLLISALLALLLYWAIQWLTSWFARIYYIQIIALLVVGILLGLTAIDLWSSGGGGGIIAAILCFALAVYHIGLALMKIRQVDGKYRWIHYHNRANVRYSIPHDDLSITTDDGVKIRAVHIASPPEQSVDDHGVRKAVIMCHGASRNKNTAPVVQTSLLLSRKYGVFSFDFRGHMESGGICYANGDEIDLDLSAVIAKAKQMGYEKIAVFGWSIGGAAALRTAGKGGQIDAIIAGAPAINLADLSEVRNLNRLPLLGIPILAAMAVIRNAKLSVRRETATLDALVPNLAGIPVLLAYNDYDYVLKAPAELFEAFYERLPIPKDKIRLPGRGHIFDWPNTYFLWEKILKWLDVNF
jgi:pimeloyl-ACP methyl ester carboxylesterase